MNEGPGLLEYGIILTLVTIVVIALTNVLPTLCLSLCCLSPILIPVWFAFKKQITEFFSELMAQIGNWTDEL